jgi:IS30 family transposase
MANNNALSREFLAERDLRIFKMRQAGVAITEIARRFNMSSSSVNASIRRQLEKMNREALLAYPEVLRLELERLDALQQSIWPMTQHRRVTTEDGTEMNVEPDMKAIQQVLSIMDRRSKLLGMEQNSVNVQLDISAQQIPVRATLSGAEKDTVALSTFSPENEARQLLEIMGRSGVLPRETVNAILSGGEKQQDIIDAEVVDLEENNEQ